MGFNLTFQDREDKGGDFPLIEEGDYDCRIEKAENSHSDAGNSTIKIRLAVLDTAGARIGAAFDTLTNVENCLWRVEACLQSICMVEGMKPFPKGHNMPLEAAQLLGKGCRAHITIEEKYQAPGKMVNKVGTYRVEKEVQSPLAPPVQEPPAAQGADAPADDLPFEGVGESKPEAFVAPE